MLTQIDDEIVMAPAYDLVCTKIVIPDDKEDSAGTINGRKNKLARGDFDALRLCWCFPAEKCYFIIQKEKGAPANEVFEGFLVSLNKK